MGMLILTTKKCSMLILTDDEEMVDGNIDDKDEEMVNANIDDEEKVNFEVWDGEIYSFEFCQIDVLIVVFVPIYKFLDDVMELKYKSKSSFAESKLLKKVLQSSCLLQFSVMLGHSYWTVETISALQRLNQLGKTLAFGVPDLVHDLCKKMLGDSGRACPWCSVLSPTRELAQQSVSSDLDEFEGFVGNDENDGEDLGGFAEDIRAYAMVLLAQYLDLCGGHRAISHGIGLKVQPKQDDLLQGTTLYVPALVICFVFISSNKKMRLYSNHEEEAASICDEEMVDGDANINEEELVDGDANIDDEEMVDANIDNADEEIVDANIDD
ncbi:hypothetical protein Sjap_022057 [Stephania japonica]|uniref:Uncharacterized protein n=1 Tax=Stephania japonica TaxID=461633 RepID=A0AAP0EQR8_9MAGN